jgi:ubiquitin-protein ligase
MTNRIKKELELLSKNIYIHDLKYADNIFTFRITHNPDDKCSVLIPEDYPFKAPIVFYRNRRLQFKDNWSPALMLDDIAVFLRVLAFSNPILLNLEEAPAEETKD